MALDIANLRPSPAQTAVRNLVPLAIGLALALVMHFGFLPGVSLVSDAGDYYSKIATDIGIAIVLAVSLNMVNGFTGQFSIGHAGFMAIGGYFAAAMSYYGHIKLFGSPQQNGGMLSHGLALEFFHGSFVAPGDALFIVSCLVGGLVAALAGYVVGLPSLRLRGDYLAIVTLGFGEIVRVLLQASEAQITGVEAVKATPIWKLPAHLGEAVGFNFIPAYTSLFWTYLLVAITVLVAYRLKSSTFGRAFLSIREDEIAAEAMGIHTTKFKVRAFVLSAFFAGVAGGLFAHQIGSVNAGELGFMKSFDIVIMVVLGGLGSISGAILAAAIITILPEVLREFASYRMIVYALALILMMILRPSGLFGVREIWELRRRKPGPAKPGGAP